MKTCNTKNQRPLSKSWINYSEQGSDWRTKKCIFILYIFNILYTRWFKVPFSSPSWRSLNPLKGVTIPKRSLWITRYIYIHRLRLILGSVLLRKMRHETGWGDARSASPPRAIARSPTGPPNRRYLFQDDDELFFLGHQLGYLPSSWSVGLTGALPKVDTSFDHPCVCVCINVKSFWPILLFLRSQKKKKTILTYHHSVHKAKVCFGMVFFCPPQRSTKRFFRRGNKSARRVPQKGAFSISNFRRSISAISCSLSLSAYHD